MRAIKTGLLFICTFFIAACGLNQKGMVMVTDDSYKASVFSTNKSGINTPDGLWWRQGKMLIADEGGGAIRMLDNKGNLLQTLCDSKLGIMSPEDTVMDAEGNIFFTDDDAGGIWEVDKGGNAFLLAGKDKGLVSTEGIALAPTGDILVGDGERHQIFNVTRTGEVSVFLGTGYGITKPESMVFDEKGNLYIADNQDQIVYVLTPEQKLLRLIEGRENFSPETIWHTRGVLFITDSTNGKLYRYTPEEGLKTIAVFGGKLGTVCGITMDENDSIYLSIQTDLKRKIGYILKLDHEPQA